ncbi:Glu/Leu/Phe/Val dehydrogenase family protein [Chakrabartyella piscis]|uniref:Glu/Leu/Phe/Val dehydrogenase family protein n=1 Tax=Chakrabartyella piscis TaxID=2918914 RepID=UPI002958CD74|nr:Glu/Leu/Phe/Val dehydrogenase family protein [Chakrabartyella piscis]
METKSLFYPMQQEGFTTLRIQYDWKTDAVFLQMSKDWDEDLDWSKYNQDFYVESIKTKNAKFLNDTETRALFATYNLSEYLQEVIELIRAGKHFGIDCFYHEGYDIKYLGNMHNRKRGINNTRHGVMKGGIRRHAKEDLELEVIIDGLNLGRAMTFKNIAGELPVGGCKSCVIMDELDLTNMQHCGFLGFCLDEIRCSTGPDMGFSPTMTDVMKENNFSVQYTCGPNGPLGSSGPPTAYGVYVAMKEANRFLCDDPEMAGYSFAVQGLGEVGAAFVDYLAKGIKDVKIFVADINVPMVEKIVAKYTEMGIDITAVDPSEILTLEVDVVAPCAMGGIIDEEIIPKLNCKMVWGSANNQVKASSVEEECRIAKIIADRGILFQTDWWHNTAGVMFGYEEYKWQKEASLERAYKDIDRVLPVKTWDNLNKAKELGITPTECAYLTCNDLLYGK